MSDVGLRFLERFFAALGVEDRWTLGHDRGFTWLGYWLAQRVEVGPAFTADSLAHCLVRIQTTIAHNVDPLADPAGVLGRLNRDGTLSALVWSPHTGTIVETATAVVTAIDIEPMCQVLHTVAALQCDSAHRRALQITQACNARIAVVRYPRSGERSDPDPLLDWVRDEVVAAGAESSRFVGAFERALGRFGSATACSVEVTPTDLHCEVPYTGSVPTGPQHWNTPPAGTDPQTALVRMFTDQPHPRIGNGALSLLHLPVAFGRSGAALAANQLNAVAAHGGVGAALLGAWCVEPTRPGCAGLVFCSFLPNTLARSGLLQSHLVELAAQAQFALHQLSPSPVPPVSHSAPSTGELPHDIH